jgi:DNA mismatch endonuclease (patch repair protein)
MMSGIRGSNTRPELAIRSRLHRAGYRFRLNVRSLPGTPDIVLPRHRAIVFVNGCFWHGHGCHLFKLPATRREFWQKKIRDNRARDRVKVDECKQLGWRVAIVWECALKGRHRLDPDVLVRQLGRWIESQSKARTFPRVATNARRKGGRPPRTR